MNKSLSMSYADFAEIIQRVEQQTLQPSCAVKEAEKLKKKSAPEFNPTLSVRDFEKIRDKNKPVYEFSNKHYIPFETSFEEEDSFQ